jgi:peptidyl-prolyl cis-trans isomerase C
MDSLLKDKFTLGGDASVAAGPVGRATSAETDAAMKAKILSYSRSRGAFAGVSLTGTTLHTDEDANKAVLEDLIAQFLLAKAAREANFSLTDADLQARIDALGDAATLTAWQSAHGYDDASFRVALKRSVEAAWMRDKIIADTPTVVEQIHLRQILTYNQEDANYALQQLQGGTEFDTLSALYDPITLGELGWVPRGYLLDPKADEAVFALQAGGTSGIIQTDAGFHIFKALERSDHPLTADALLTVQEQALQDWVTKQRASSEIVLNP